MYTFFPQLECLAVNFCNKVTGSCLKTVFQRSKRLRCLLMNQTGEFAILIIKNSIFINRCNFPPEGLLSEHLMQVEWEKSALQELDITGTDLSTECLIDMFTRIPALRYLSAGQINGFNDSVSLKFYLLQVSQYNFL
jgi:hypothetical protein